MLFISKFGVDIVFNLQDFNLINTKSRKYECKEKNMYFMMLQDTPTQLSQVVDHFENLKMVIYI